MYSYYFYKPLLQICLQVIFMTPFEKPDFSFLDMLCQVSYPEQNSKDETEYVVTVYLICRMSLQPYFCTALSNMTHDMLRVRKP